MLSTGTLLLLLLLLLLLPLLLPHLRSSAPSACFLLLLPPPLSLPSLRCCHPPFTVNKKHPASTAPGASAADGAYKSMMKNFDKC